MRQVDAAAVRAALPFAVVIDASPAMLASGCTVPQQHTCSAQGFTSVLMRAWTKRS